MAHNFPSKMPGRLSLVLCLFGSLAVFITSKAQATDYFVATTGSNANPRWGGCI
jgi:hypothetical protein